MKAIIIGGGKIGYYLAKILIEKGHDISVLEISKSACQVFANELKVTVVKGDGTTVSALERAGIKQCNCLIAVTGQDEDNLVACELAKRLYNVEKTIAKVNNPKNVAALKLLGVDIVVSATDSITAQLEREVGSGRIKELLPLNHGKAAVFELVLEEDFTLADIPLSKMNIPHTCNIISITRDNNLLIPRGQTTLKIGDSLLILANQKDKNDVFKAFKLKRNRE